MATNLSQTGLEVDKVEHGDIATGGTDKVLLYASGSGAATRLYVKAGSNTQKQLGFDIDQFDAKGDASIHQTDDHFIMSDGGTEKKITFSNMEDAIFANVSGDATIAAGGALTLAANSVSQVQLDDDAVGADELASNAVVNASVVDGALKADKLDLDGSTDIGADLADADLVIVDDGAGGTNRVSALSRVKKYIYSAMSGDATASDAGALTIANDAVESGMLNDNVISGQTELAHADIVDADELMISDGGTLKKVGVDSLRDHFFGVVSGDATVADGGALTIAANAVEGSMINSNAAGDGLGYASNALKVQVSGAVRISSDTVAISGSIAGAGLSYAGGVDSISQLALDIDELDAKGDASLHQTQDHFLVSDNGTEKKITFSNLQDAIFADVSGDATVAAGGALTIAADAVESGMLNDNVISGQTELASDGLAAADELMISDGGTLKKIGVDNLFKDGPGLLSAADVAVGDDHIVFLDGGATGDAKVESISDLVAGIASTGLDASSGQLSVDVSDFMTNGANNRIVTATGTDGMNGEANLQFDGTNLVLAGNMSGSGNIQYAGSFIAEGFGNFSGSVLVGAGGYNGSGVTITSAGAISGKGNLTVNGTAQFAGGYGNGDGGVDITSTGGLNMDGNFRSKGNFEVGTAGESGNSVKFHGDSSNHFMQYDADKLVFTSDNGSSNAIEIGTETTNGFAIEVGNLSGDAGKIKATAFVTYSDESLKEEVTAMENALDAVMNLKGVEFTWKNSGERDFGFLAQEVKNVLPKVVSVGNDGIHGVDYSRLTSVLVEAVKAQQVQIEELKSILKK